MKLKLPLSLIIVLINISLSFAQNTKTCDSKPEVINDLSSITKCSVEKVKNKDNKYSSELKLSYRKVRHRNISSKKVIKRENNRIAKSINTIQNDVSNNFSNNKIEALNIKKDITSREILFSVVDKVPIFLECTSKKDKRKCFNIQVSKHFSRNFYPERVTEESIKGKVFIQFTINYKGYVSDISIKSQRKSTSVEQEIKRVIMKLPKLSPGMHKGLPINVKYGIPINIDIN